MSAAVLARLLSRLFTVEEVNGGNVCPTYMYRWPVVSTRWFKVYIHRFVADDWSRDLHDHPKRFWSIGLWGSYIEETLSPCPCTLIAEHRNAERIFRAPWFRTFPATHIHRIRLTAPDRECWTLVGVGQPVRPWGFWHLGEWIPWRRYVGSDTAKQMKACE